MLARRLVDVGLWILNDDGSWAIHNYVQKNQTAEVTIDSHPGRRFVGKVIQVASISEFLPRNVQSVEERKHQVFGIKVMLTEPDAVAIIKPGMAAQVQLPLAE